MCFPISEQAMHCVSSSDTQDTVDDEDEGTVEVEEDDNSGNGTVEASEPVLVFAPNGTSKAPVWQDILNGWKPNSVHLLPPHLGISFFNATVLRPNATSEVKKITCRERNVTAANETDFYVPTVKLVGAIEELLQRLSATNDTYANCVVVMFYAPWCPFSAKVAPHYNALSRVFPRIDFLAVDAINFYK